MKFRQFEDHLSKVMDESSQLKPLLVRMLSPDPLGCLESVDRVWKVDVGIGLVDQVVQFVQGVEDGGFEVVELEPLFVL